MGGGGGGEVRRRKLKKSKQREKRKEKFCSLYNPGDLSPREISLCFVVLLFCLIGTVQAVYTGNS